jgi:acetylornithine/succinyldiaminopimelate/putrescine aminotransferase
VAAVLTEAGVITGWGSTALAPQGYLTLVRQLTQKYGALLILDEVGTGFSRCGRLFGLQRENITPDIVTLAKGLSNGVAPIGAMVTTQEIAEKTSPLTNIYSTFGWLPVACAAAQKTLEIHQREKIWEKAEADGKYLREVLEKELNQKDKLYDIRGLGMEIGVTYLGPTVGEKSWADQIVETAYQKGLHLVGDHENNLQLMPPLTISRQELDIGLNILVAAIKNPK